jgi:hypothetical protein
MTNITSTVFGIQANGSVITVSSVTAGGTLTIVPKNTFGIFYNITNTGIYTIALAASQPSSNIGKYNVFRNNSVSSMNFTVTNGIGITSPILINSLQGATIVADTTASYVQF